ncbi:MAG TPA: hypothetical protein VF940_09330 [Streptosporangiaceae bacterium]
MAQPLEAVRQPRVHFGDAVLQQGQVPVVVKQPGFDAGYVRGEPLAVAERDELVLPAVHWDGSRWRVARRFKETSYPAALTGVTAISRTDVWVFGGVITGVTPLVGFGTCQLPHPRHLRTAWLTLARWTAPQATPGARATSTEQPASSRTAWPWILTGSHCGGSGASSS